MSKFLKRIGDAALCAAIAACVPSLVVAQNYPTKAVHIVVPFPAGSSTDFMARLFADKLARKWGQSVVVENKAGAAGNIGSRHVAMSEADGHTLLFSTVANAIGAAYANLGYDLQKDLSPVALVATAPLVIVSNPQLPPADFQELIKMAKSSPEKLTFGTGGHGTATHFAGEYLNVAAGVRIQHIPYKGATAAQTDLLGGRLTVLLDNLAGVQPLINSGRLKALAVTSPERSPRLPDVPTLQELGVANFEALGWQGIHVPAGTNAYIIDKLNEDIGEILAQGDTRIKIDGTGATPAGGTVADFSAFVESEIVKWRKVAQTAGIKDGE